MSEADKRTWRPRLSARGRQKFGEWLANRLVVAAGGLVALIVVPDLAGKITIGALGSTACLVLSVLMAFAAIFVHYMTSERRGEHTSPASEPD